MVEHEPTGWVDKFTLAISRIAMALVVIIVLVMFTEVVMRYVFAKPTLWANELSRIKWFIKGESTSFNAVFTRS